MVDEIRTSGSKAEVDALDEADFNSHIDTVLRRAGTIDVSFCAIDFQVVQNISLVDLNVDDFVRPVTIAMRSQFLTASAAGKIMMKQSFGIILSLTATPGGIGYPFTGGFAPTAGLNYKVSRIDA